MTVSRRAAGRAAATLQAEPGTTPELDGHLLRIIAGGRAGSAGSPATARRADRYRRFLDALGVAVYTTDADGRITFFNAAAADFWGRRPMLGELWCGSLRLLWPDGSPMRHDECPMAVTLHEARPVRGGQAIAVRPDATQVSFVAYPTPLFDDDGQLIGAVNVLVDITERHRAEQDLQALADALSASNAVKDEFLGLVSHELRTPVTTIFGNARLLQSHGAGLTDTVRAAMVDDIATDADRLHVIIENLLQLTRLGSGVHPEMEPQILNRVIEREVASFRARNPGRVIVYAPTDRHAIVEADETLLTLVVENLLGNAVKYSPADQPIEVRVTIDSSTAEVAVLDRGIGFEEAEGGPSFEPFQRSTAARAIANGLGIGLALCRRIVELLGGRIQGRSRPGGGAVFSFELPLAVDNR
jgi:PAS domain S-box-containing protein